MSGTVLVVDDERKIRDLVRTYLEREGYQVLDTGSGDSALDIARRLQPDLVVLDLGLPDLDGQNVVRALRANRPGPHGEPNGLTPGALDRGQLGLASIPLS